MDSRSLSKLEECSLAHRLPRAVLRIEVGTLKRGLKRPTERAATVGVIRERNPAAKRNPPSVPASPGCARSLANWGSTASIVIRSSVEETRR
jgi:hypothetical protein